MGFFIRALSVLNGVREWASFAHEAFSWRGLAKRTAAAAAGAAVIATPVVVMSKPSAPAEAVSAQGPAHTESAAEVEDKIEKIGLDNIYSKVYLSQPEHQGLMDAIIAKCKVTNELPAQQCDIAVHTKAWLAHRAFLAEQSKKVQEADRRLRESLNSPSAGATGPTQIRMFKE